MKQTTTCGHCLPSYPITIIPLVQCFFDKNLNFYKVFDSNKKFAERSDDNADHFPIAVIDNLLHRILQFHLTLLAEHGYL